MQLIKTLEVHNELGEGIIWDHAAAKIWWTDILQSTLYCYDPETEELESWSTPERLCCFAPIQGRTDLAVAFESGFAFYNPKNGAVEWLHKLETDNPGTRFNDGRTDRQGRLWAGTMVEDADKANDKGKLYCLHSDLTVSHTLTGLSIPNSLCWSPNGQTVYHTDTPTQTIHQYAYNTEKATFSEAQLFTKTAQHAYPDGSIVDAEGYVWNAQWGASQVVRYAPDGHADLTLKLPTSQITCVAFGGKDLDLLFVTSAHAEMTDADDQAGNVFIFKSEAKGLLESPFIIQ